MSHKEKKINDYIDMMLQAEQNGRGEEAIFYADKAASIKCKKPEFQWITSYNYCIMHYLYDVQTDKGSLYQKMLNLVRDAYDLNDSSFAAIFDAFLRLQYYLLLFGMDRCTRIEKYSNIAHAFFRCLKENNIYKVNGLDYYGISVMALCHYYSKTGQVLSAIKYGELYLQCIEESKILSAMEFRILTFLASSYLRKNDFRNAKKICLFLYKKILSGEKEETSQECLQIWLLVYSGAYIKSMLFERGFDLILECIQKGIVYHDNPDDSMYAIYSNMLKYEENQSYTLPKEVLDEMEIVFSEKCSKLDKLARDVKAEVYYSFFKLYLKKQKKDLARNYILEAVQCFLNGNIHEDEREPFLLIMPEGIRYFHSIGELKMEEKIADCIMRNLKLLYSYAEFYIDNVEMERYIVTVDILFRVAYYHYVNTGKTKEAFVYSANYKNCLLSVVKARNERLYHDKYSGEILQSYNSEKNDFVNKKEYNFNKDNLNLVNYEDLKELEYQFSETYTKNRELMFYTYENIMTNLEKNTAIIEIVCSSSDFCQGNLGTKNMLEYEKNRKAKVDVFVIAKTDSVHFLHKSIRQTGDLYQQLNLLLQRIEDSKLKIDQLAENIGRNMFESFYGLLESVECIYISPHMDFYKVPFGLIFDYCNPEIAKKEIIYCQSLRDLFESDHGVTDTLINSCIIGGPSYEINTRTDIGQQNRLGMRQNNQNLEAVRNFEIGDIQPLPFSEYEVSEIGKITGSGCSILEEATKNKVKKGYSYLHIATHGCQRKVGELNAWYDSALAFSGVKNAYILGREKDKYGNGLLTAEEISRMELKETNLVTLSACMSADSRYSLYEQQSGLHLAFSVAGVKYVISSLWEVDDISGSLLMIFLYENLKRGESVPAALDVAKIKLRTTTVKELRKRFSGRVTCSGVDLGRVVSLEFGEYPEETCPFSAPKDWASFICYQYKF